MHCVHFIKGDYRFCSEAKTGGNNVCVCVCVLTVIYVCGLSTKI